MCQFIPWRKLKNLQSFLYNLLLFLVIFYISFFISSRCNPKIESQNFKTNCSNLYKLCGSILCLSAIDIIRCLQTNLVRLKIEICTLMCLYNNVKNFENHLYSIGHEQIFFVQLNVIVFNQPNLSTNQNHALKKYF